jgi:hypothetical protein
MHRTWYVTPILACPTHIVTPCSMAFKRLGYHKSR